jgi:hypothetical protein
MMISTEWRVCIIMSFRAITNAKSSGKSSMLCLIKTIERSKPMMSNIRSLSITSNMRVKSAPPFRVMIKSMKKKISPKHVTVRTINPKKSSIPLKSCQEIYLRLNLYRGDRMSDMEIFY